MQLTNTEQTKFEKFCRRNQLMTSNGVISIALGTTYPSKYVWRTLTGLKLNNNRTQYSRPAIFWPELYLH